MKAKESKALTKSNKKQFASAKGAGMKKKGKKGGKKKYSKM